MNDLQSLVIRDVKGLVTNVSTEDLSSDFALRTRGFRYPPGSCGERDWGTKHRTGSGTKPSSLTSILDGTVIYDPTTGTEHDLIVGLDGSNNTKVYIYDSAWIELNQSITATVSDGAIGATDKHVTIDVAGTYDVGHEFQGWLCVNSTHASTVIITDSDAKTGGTVKIYTPNTLGSSGLNWQTGTPGDSLTFYRTTAQRSFVSSNGTTPQLSFALNEKQKKCTIAYGSSASPPVMNQPVIVQKNAAKSLFYDSAGSALLTLPAAWQMELGGGLAPFNTVLVGTPDAPCKPNSNGTAKTYTFDVAETDVVMHGTFDVTNITQNNDVFMAFVYGTLEYNGYEESDPVFQLYTAGYAVTDGPWIQNFALSLDPAKMNKSVTALRIYVALVTQALYEAGAHRLVADTAYVLWETIRFDQDQRSTDANRYWSAAPNDANGRMMVAGVQQIETITGAYATGSSSSVKGALGRPLDKKRTPLKPRYLASASRDKGGVVVGDEDDRTLRATGYNGDGVHQDDDFADVTLDSSGVKLKIQLSSQGQLLGVAAGDSQVTAFKQSEVELVDLYSGVQRIIPADFVAKRSIVQTPWGTCWAGNSGIWIMPNGGGRIELLNGVWQNFYDGTLKNAHASKYQFVTATARAAIKGGYDPAYREAWFEIECYTETGATTEFLCFRYSFDDNKWTVRKLGTGRVAFFSRHALDMTIGYATGLLFYPNKTGALPYEDGVSSADATAGYGIETSQILHLGSLYSPTDGVVVDSLELDHDGSCSPASQTVKIDVYANKESSPYTTAYRAVDAEPAAILLPPRGLLERVRVGMSLTGTLTNFKDYALNTLSVRFKALKRFGNQ